MKKLSFKTTIQAPAEKVWAILWNDTTYRQWTAVFHEGSYAVSDWKEGDKIQFLGPGGGGMFSVIEKSVPNSHMAFKHLGIVKDFEEQPSDEETKKWAGSMEVYNLTEYNGTTELRVEIDAVDEHADYFNGVFPKGLEVVQQLAEGTLKPMIIVTTQLKMPVAKAWEFFTQPQHITQWCFASDDWHAPRAENDVRSGGKFLTRMEAKDGSFGFDWEGVYSEVKPNEVIKYVMSDGREAHVFFIEENGVTKVVERFHPENENPHEVQRGGWQAILDNYSKYATSKL